MPRTIFLFLFGAGIFFACQFLAGADAPKQKPIRIAPESGGVELEEIAIIRRAIRGAGEEAELTGMEIKLWFSAIWQKKGFHSLIRLHALDPIEDDTGKILSTEKRIKQIEYLDAEAQGEIWISSDGKAGPIARLFLDVPARKATKIEAIKGKAEVSLMKPVTLQFADLPVINRKDLSHPDMKALGAQKWKFSIEEEKKWIIAKLTFPKNNGNPGFQARLTQWDLIDAKKKISFFSEGFHSDKNGYVVEKTYYGKISKSLSLQLTILEPVETKTFAFHFKNVKLP